MQWSLFCHDLESGGPTVDLGVLTDDLGIVPQFQLYPDGLVLSVIVNNGNKLLARATADGSQALQQLTGPALELSGFAYVPQTNRVVYGGEISGTRTWYLSAPDGTSLVTLISEPASTAVVLFIGYIPAADLYVFQYDSNPLPAVRRNLIGIRPDGSPGPDLSDGGAFHAGISGPSPRLSPDGRSVVFVDSTSNFQGDQISRLRRTDAVTEQKTTLASFSVPAGGSPLQISVFFLSPTDPDGALLRVADAPAGQQFDYYVTYSGPPAPLFADGFE